MANPTPPQRTIFLVRHGEAVSKQEDSQRPLAESGRRHVQMLAAWAANASLSADEIVHSGKLRAAQTAEIIAKQLQPAKGTSSRSDIGPNDDVRPVADDLAEGGDRVMVVGHLPFLSRLVSQLVIGDADQPLVQFEAACLVELTNEGGKWAIACVVHPGLLRQS